MEDEFVTFQKFQDLAMAEPLIVLLKDNDIEFVLEDNSPKSGKVFLNNPLDNQFLVKVKQKDFEKADKLLTDNAEKELDSVEKDDYLFGFSDVELMEIVTKPDEWTKSDYLLALKILKDRGKEVNVHEAESIKEQRIEDLAKPEPSQKIWIVIGYIFAVCGGFYFASIGALIGIFIGWYLYSFKKTLPDGSRVYVYNEQDRMNGKRIFIIGILSCALWVGMQIARRV